jgi:hypothetical protein
MVYRENLRQLSETIWELPAGSEEGIRVPAGVHGTRELIEQMDDAVKDQISNVATVPGIARYALCMPDGHSGHGVPKRTNGNSRILVRKVTTKFHNTKNVHLTATPAAVSGEDLNQEVCDG